MKSFAHINARTLKEACTLLKKYDGKAAVNAGGTDLLAVFKDRILPNSPDVVINIKTIKGLKYIKEDKEGLRIGALTNLTELVKSPIVKQRYGVLFEAAKSVATPHIRNMCTIGGNLVQHVRCWYYRYPRQIGGPILCLRKGGKTCNALLGDNRYHSIFGGSISLPYPCSSNCPAAIDIPSYLSKVRNGNILDAVRTLLESNPMPAVTGRVCPVFCEPGCNRGEFDEPVAIHSIERSLGDLALERATEFFLPPEIESGKSIAIVGSGPAGLSAAYYLRRSGHMVTVFERFSELGGMLLYSIPPYRLPKDIVKKQIHALENMGIRFEVGIHVGKDVSFNELMSRFKAVFVAGGTWKSVKLGVPGEEASEVSYALDYLYGINSGKRLPIGRKVIVVGGGSVAIDAARTAKRQGAQEVHLLCLECRDLTSKDRMLAQDNEVQEAEEEGIIIHDSLGVKAIITKDGKAVGIETIPCLSVREQDGTFNPKYDNSCTAETLKADSIIVAIGQVADQSFGTQGLDYNQRGTISVDQNTLETGMKGVFAGGDIVAGPSTVVQAIASGKKVADIIGALFNDRLVATNEAKSKPEFSDSFFDPSPRVSIQELPISERIKSILGENMRSLNNREMETEAARCYNCGCVAVNPSDIGIALMALDAKIATTKRAVEAQHFFSANSNGGTVLDPDELVTEIQVPKPPDGAYQNYLKFTVRKPVDFAIVSVASIMTLRDGICTDARIVLGAVAPKPLRMTSAEEILKGSRIDESKAVEAAKIAVSGAKPLSNNGYKVQITKNLVKKAILACLPVADSKV
jgi:NADPH-dependent glutamate synthase beta subunit-like oxidoreductase